MYCVDSAPEEMEDDVEESNPPDVNAGATFTDTLMNILLIL